MDHQSVAVPEADRVPFPEGIGLVLGHVAAAVGIDPMDLGVLLGQEPGFLGPQDELAQERLDDPARVAGGQAGGQRIPLDALLHVLQLLLVALAELGRQRGGGVAAVLVGIEVEAVRLAPEAGPVGQVSPAHGGPAVGG